MNGTPSGPWRFHRRGLTARTARHPRPIAAPRIGRLAAHALSRRATAPARPRARHRAGRSPAAARGSGPAHRRSRARCRRCRRPRPAAGRRSPGRRATAPCASGRARCWQPRPAASSSALASQRLAPSWPLRRAQVSATKRSVRAEATWTTPLLVAQPEHPAVVAHQQVGRRRRPEQQADRHDRQSGEAPATTPQAEPQAADGDQPQAGARHRRHQRRRVRPAADIPGDPVQAFDAPAHGHQRRSAPARAASAASRPGPTA